MSKRKQIFSSMLSVPRSPHVARCDYYRHLWETNLEKLWRFKIVAWATKVKSLFMAISKHNVPTCPIINTIHGGKKCYRRSDAFWCCVYIHVSLRSALFLFWVSPTQFEDIKQWSFFVMFIKLYCCHSLMKLNYNTTQYFLSFPLHICMIMQSSAFIYFISCKRGIWRSPTQHSYLIDMSFPAHDKEFVTKRRVCLLKNLWARLKKR